MESVDPFVPTLQRSAFDQVVEVLALRVEQKLIGSMIKRLGGYLLDRPRVKMVIPDKGSTKKILLKEELKDPGLSELPEDTRKFVLENSQVTKHNLKLSYAHLTSNQVLAQLLPPDLPLVTSFECVGHIAHMNLRECLQPYKHLIGQVILDKNPTLRTVVNKCATISSVFRTFHMEVIAGDNDLNTEVREGKCRFRFNYGEVYWNSRLQYEHNRLISKFSKNDVVCDMFAGVGPFAIPAAKNIGCHVHANDLNPKSYQALCDNVLLNKVEGLVKCYNMDGREFVGSLLSHNPPIQFSQVLMNLPASAEAFLDAFIEYPEELKLPTIHCYVFASSTNPVNEAIHKVSEVLGKQVTALEVHEVRDVAPKKRMMCVSFVLPPLTSPPYVKQDNMETDELSFEQTKRKSRDNEEQENAHTPEPKNMRCPDQKRLKFDPEQ